jgi:hypothetical protein
VRGRVLHVAPQPLAAASITVTDSTGRHVGHAYSDADGAFEIAVDSPGLYLVHTARNGDRPFVREVRLGFEGADMEITLTDRGFGICGMVRDIDGRAVAAASVVALDLLGETLGRARTDAAGRYELGDLPGGEHTLVVLAPGYHPAANDLALPASGMHARSELLHPITADAPLVEPVD